MGQSSEATNISAIISMSNTVGRNDRSGYTQKALAQIRNSLLPFANETGSTLSSSATTSSTSSSSLTRAGLENNNKELIQQHWVQRLAAMGYAEEAIVRAVKVTGGRSIEAALDWLHKQEQCELQQRPDPINSLARASGPGFSVLTTNVVRKPSFERDFHRASPALDSSNASTRSDSPGLASLSGLAALTAPVRGYVAPEPPPHTAYSHPHLSRTYSPSTLALPPSNESPPPPAPPPRGTTPPPPPLPPPPSAAAMASVHHLLKRMSPVPRSASSLSSGPQSAPPTPTSNGPPPAQPPPPPLPTRGNSPAPALPARPPPLIVHNGPQAQAQFSQQMQALNLNNNAAMTSTSATNPEPPPPYPVGSNKLTTPPPSYHASAAFSRQSPTFSCSPSPTMMGGQPPPIRSWTQSASISAASVSNKPMKTPPPPPVIMQSVKSTQVQKPVLQTAVAPTAPPPTTSLSSTNHTPSPPPPPPPYSSSGYGSACPSPFTSPSPLSFASNISPAPPSGSPAPPPVPTTDPPSYASTMQALAAQRSMQTTAPTLFPSTMNAFGKLPLDAINARKRVSPVSMAGLTVNVGLASAHGAATVGLEDRSGVDSPSMSVMGDTRPGPSHSPGSVTSSIPGSEATQDSGLGMGPSSVGKPEDNKDLETPPPPPPPYKLTHQSPIPERKFMSREKDEERRETKLRNYSPQAFKFYMEQHVENLMKSHQQRMHRRLQLETEMVKIGLSEEAQYQMRKMLSQKESNYIRLKRAKMDKSMFTKIRAIGVGAFGEVALVRKIDTNHLYAMKTLRKTDVLKRNQVAHVKAERDILAEADNEWVVKLYYSFQDKDNLYFVMDYIPGGDLMSLLIKFGIFEEPLARFYIAELVCAVESVHKMGFIHRDIKPDNILIDRDGHIKLTDFGLCTGFRWTHNSKYYQRNGDHARQDSFDPGEDWTNECRCQCNPALGNSNNLNGNNGTNAGNTCPLTPHPANTPITVLKPLERRRRREHLRCLAHSLVGTPNYIAPEVLMRTGYTQQCDWWSVGVILYEMLVGQPPFLANTPAETQYKVINWEHTLRIPKQANLSQEAADLILRLCTSSEQRLGRGGATELKSHGFFAGVDFEGGLRHQQAPYIPKIRFATDTSNFDPIDPDKLRNSSGGEADKLDNTLDNGKHPVHAFFEFTFRRFFDDGGHAYPVQRISVDDNENQGPVYV